jgi:alpha-D-ribose 1-methylphosphonate 5-triphosphate synthase subunit PhnH
MFAVGTWAALAPLSAFPVGTSEYPDRSTTLIVEQNELTAGALLTGPGIKDTAGLNLPETAAFQTNRAMFPLGLDFVFTCGNQLAALPRSTIVNAPCGATEEVSCT